MTKVRLESAELQLSAAADAHPVAPSDRILAIDIVRGIALFGVMAINVTTEFRVSIFEQFLHDWIDGGWLDRALHSFLMIGVNLKAFALFSLLFGVGLAIQHDHLSAHPQRIILFIRRLAFLMLVGAVHLLFVWNGDILFSTPLQASSWSLCFLDLSTQPRLAPALVFIASPFLPPSRPYRTEIGWRKQSLRLRGSMAPAVCGSAGLCVHELPGFCRSTYSFFRERSP
jgi:uncharacterized protein